jgi:tripartite-type tricarboxylate transporter receptor subunit TctC
MTLRMGANVEPVPYKGEAPMWLDVVSGQITAGQGSVLALMPHLQSGRLRAIAVSTRNRSPLLPDVPTFAEQGFTEPVFTVEGWLGLFAPAGTPREIVQRVSELVQEGASSPRIQQLNKTFGMTDKPWSAAEFERVDRQVKPIWIGLARELNLTLD